MRSGTIFIFLGAVSKQGIYIISRASECSNSNQRHKVSTVSEIQFQSLLFETQFNALCLLNPLTIMKKLIQDCSVSSHQISLTIMIEYAFFSFEKLPNSFSTSAIILNTYMHQGKTASGEGQTTEKKETNAE